jgi:hypothetical protein
LLERIEWPFNVDKRGYVTLCRFIDRVGYLRKRSISSANVGFLLTQDAPD